MRSRRLTGVAAGLAAIAVAMPAAPAAAMPAAPADGAPAAGQAHFVERVRVGGVARQWDAPSPGPKVTLEVTATALHGQSARGDSVLVGNADNARLFFRSLTFQRGVAKAQVPAGQYWALGTFTDKTDGKITAARLVVLPQFTVSGDTTVHLAERSANSEIAMTPPRPAVLRDTGSTCSNGSPHRPARPLPTCTT